MGVNYLLTTKIHQKLIILTQTLNLTFLYVTVSTLNPTVGIVVTDWPSFNLYKIAGIKKHLN